MGEFFFILLSRNSNSRYCCVSWFCKIYLFIYYFFRYLITFWIFNNDSYSSLPILLNFCLNFLHWNIFTQFLNINKISFLIFCHHYNCSFSLFIDNFIYNLLIIILTDLGWPKSLSFYKSVSNLLFLKDRISSLTEIFLVTILYRIENRPNSLFVHCFIFLVHNS